MEVERRLLEDHFPPEGVRVSFHDRWRKCRSSRGALCHSQNPLRGRCTDRAPSVVAQRTPDPLVTTEWG